MPCAPPPIVAVTTYMPMVPELPATMLACARIGAVHSVVFGGFSADSLAQRLEDARSRVLVTCSGVMRGPKRIELKRIADDAMAQLEARGHAVTHCLVYDHPSPAVPQASMAWLRLAREPGHRGSGRHTDTPPLAPAVLHGGGARPALERVRAAHAHCVPRGVARRRGPQLHALHVGVHGQAQGSPAHHGRIHDRRRHHVQVSALAALLLPLAHVRCSQPLTRERSPWDAPRRYVFGYRPGDVYWCGADCGWITGHSYVVYGPLLCGATQVVFEGIPTWPDAGRSWEIVDKYHVNIFYTAPTAIR